MALKGLLSGLEYIDVRIRSIQRNVNFGINLFDEVRVLDLLKQQSKDLTKTVVGRRYKIQHCLRLVNPTRDGSVRANRYECPSNVPSRGI